MGRPKKEVVYFENTQKARIQLDLLKVLFKGKKTSEEILADAVAMLYEKEKPNIVKMAESGGAKSK